MNKFILAALLCPFLGTMTQAQTPSTSQTDPAPRAPGPLMGAYAPEPTNAPLVADARTFIQNHLATMSLNEVTEAYLQVVAGLNVKLVCEVMGDDGASTWQFVAFRSLDGQWHLHSATRL